MTNPVGPLPKPSVEMTMIAFDRPIHYAAFDPGVTTGYCLFDEQGLIIQWGQCGWEQLLTKINTIITEDTKVVIIEDFQLYRRQAMRQVGSRFETVQVIGVLRARAAQVNAGVVLQQPSIKPIAEKLTQIKPKGVHANTHWIDALNHGFYYLIGTGIRKVEI